MLLAAALLIGQAIVGGALGEAAKAALPTGVWLYWVLALLSWACCILWAFLCGWWGHRATAWGAMAGLFQGIIACLVVAAFAASARDLMVRHLHGAQLDQWTRAFIREEVLRCVLILGPAVVGGWVASRRAGGASASSPTA